VFGIGRREFITLVGGAAAAWPLAARAQQTGKLPTIGFLGANNASFERASTDAFVQRLRELGWIEGHNLAIEYRWAEGRSERFAEIAAEFVRLKVDVILLPGLRTVAILVNIGSPNSVLEMGRGSGGGPHGRPRCGHIGGSESRGYCARVRRAQGPRGCSVCLLLATSDDQSDSS
jgi:hypothetical protein